MGAQESSLASLDQSTAAVGSKGRRGESSSVSNFTKQLSIRRSKKRRNHERLDSANGGGGVPATSAPQSAAAPQASGGARSAARKMDRLRRSLRGSLRRRKDWREERELKDLWQCDEKLVREESCWFRVKYLGCVQVYESRGMQVCEDAIKLLRAQRRRTVRCVLHVSGQSLRVVADDTKDLLVDQTIEKVSFCAPDRNIERGFSYICRDGTTRRWMCHCFLAIGESGERLSHAVGCAFAVCLERKQQRDKDCSVSMSVDPGTSSFTRYGSFRQATLTDRLADPQNCKPAEPVPVKPVANPFAVERPRAPASLFERQGSLRVRRVPSEADAASSAQSAASPFKRQLSLRLDQLPSTVQRQQQLFSLPPSSRSRTVVEPIFELSDHEDSEPCDNVTLLSRHLNNGLQAKRKPVGDPDASTVAANDWLCSVARDLPGTAAAPNSTGTPALLDSTATSTCSSNTEGAAPSPLANARPSFSSGENSQWSLMTGRSANNPFLDPSPPSVSQSSRISPTELAIKTFELTM